MLSVISITILVSSSTSVVVAENAGFDIHEQYMLGLLNQYRLDHGVGVLTHDPVLQSQAENYASTASVFAQHQTEEEVIAYMSGADNHEGAYYSLYCNGRPWCWDESKDGHPEMIKRADFTRVGIGHANRDCNSFVNPPQTCGPWYWVVQFGSGPAPSEPPRPRLVSSIAVSPTPVTEGQRVYFTFRIDNAGGSGQTLHIDHITLKVRKPDGSIWDGPQWPLPNVTLAKGQVYEFRLDNIVPLNTPGTWTVAGIEILDHYNGWMPVEQNGITYPYFTVLQADVTPKVLIGKTGPVITHHWTWVPFSHQMEPGNWTPSGIHLIAEICSQVDGEGEHLKIKDVSTTGFYARIEEDLAFNGTHNGEYICYLAISARPTVNFRNHGSAEIIQWNRDHKNRIYYTQVPTVRRPVLASMVTANHDENAHLDIDGNVTFMEVRIEEDLALDGSHGTERIDWVVLEGTLPPQVQVGFKEGITHEWRRIRFPQPFATEPVVIAQVTTNYNLDPAVTDIRNVDRYGFDIRIEETAPCGSCVHAAGERIDWMAAPAGPYEW